MSGQIVELGGVRVFVCADEPGSLGNEQDVLDLMGEAWGGDAQWFVVPVAALDAEFLRLETRVAGAIVQKFVNYGARLVVVGDIAREIAASRALRDFVYESNRGRHVWFVDDLAALEARLAAGPRAG